MKKILFIILLILSVATYSFGADHFIDPSLEDPNTGEDGTEENPWNNWNEDVGASPTCGDTYYFKKGTVHRDAIYITKVCTSGNEVTLDAYSTGDTPIITSRVKIIDNTAGGWSGPDGGGDYTYNVGVNTIEGFWVGNTGSDTWGQESREDGDVNPEAGEWYASSGTIYYDPDTGDPSPEDADFFFEYSESGSQGHGEAMIALYLYGAEYININNLSFERSCFHGFAADSSDYIDFNTVWFRYNGTSNLYSVGGGYISIGNGLEIKGSSDHITVTDSIAEYQFDNGLTVESGSNTPPSDVVFTRCIGRYNAASGASVKCVEGSPSRPSHATFEYCEFYENGYDITGSNHYSYSGIKCHEDSIATIKWCYIHDNLGAGIQLQNNPLSGWTTLIFGNVITGNATGNTTGWPGNDRGACQDGGITIWDDYGNAGESIIIYNNTISDNTLYGIYQFNNTNVADLYIENNIITGNTSQDVRIESDDVSVTIDNNLYSASLSNYLGSTSYSNPISTWNTVTGVGTDINGNPYLDTDYTPLSNSPANDEGDSSIGVTYDDIVLPTSTWPDSVTTGDQDDYGTGWEIGAFIYTGATSGPIISNNLPTTTQSCDGVASTDEISLDTDRDATCRASRKGTDTCATAYASLDVEMTDEGGNHHTFTGTGAGEPGYLVTCGSEETIVVICQDDSTSEYSSCSEWTYEVNPAATGVIAQRHPVTWASIAQIHPKAVAAIAQIHPITTSVAAGEVACDVCAAQPLMFSWHMENNDITPDVTIHDVITDPCGCSDGDTIGAGTASPVFDGASYSDGSYSLYVDGLDDRYDFTVDTKDIIDPDDIKMTFDIKVTTYPASGYAEVIRASYNADNNMVVQLIDIGVVRVLHIGGADSDSVEVSVATGSFVSCEYQSKQGVAGNDHYLICGATSDEDDDDMTAMAASMGYLQMGDHYGTGVAVYNLDNVKIYPCDKY